MAKEGNERLKRLCKKPANPVSCYPKQKPLVLSNLHTHTKLPALSLLESYIFEVRTKFNGVGFLLLICPRSI